MRRPALPLLLPLLLLLLLLLAPSPSCQTVQQQQQTSSDNVFEFKGDDNRLQSLSGVGFGSDSGDERALRRYCSCQCGVANYKKRIVGGWPTGVNRYPWVARLVYDGKFHCGGSLLNADYVLTAAHCVYRLNQYKFRIILGDYDQTSTTETPAVMRAVSRVIIHPYYIPETMDNDIALLRLNKPVRFTYGIRPVCLPPKGAGDPAGRTGTVVGWGGMVEGGLPSAVLLEAHVPILSRQYCRYYTEYKPSEITDNMICAGNGSQDSCTGDSGGPLTVTGKDKRHEIVGLVSFGEGCGLPEYPGVYTRVLRYLNWVRSHMWDTCHCS